eukprot:TRINITY_DN11651_c0_g1_i1.p1 TRINITY_DN11651_c0_g1~~TRINITY_DN11651_c0_g1_i1.p1  ORF type:complete len:177 (+),score=12.09 TRINITY_DN11651_c0_g1_i1:220-750(+)
MQLQKLRPAHRSTADRKRGTRSSSTTLRRACSTRKDIQVSALFVETKNFITELLGKDIPVRTPVTLVHLLSNGMVLCKLVNLLYPRQLDKSKVLPVNGVRPEAKIMIEEFLRVCKQNGVPEKRLFTPNDVLLCENIERIFACLLTLKLLSKKQRRQQRRSAMVTRNKGGLHLQYPQ